jgi:hypothetical protein
MFTMAPSFRFSMCGITCRLRFSAEVTLKWNAASKASSVSCRTGVGGVPPALFTRRSTPSNSLTVSATRWSSCAETVTSQGTARERLPMARISPATSSMVSTLRAATTTWAPASAKPRAIPRPIPLPPPVTMATLSVSLN